MTYFGEQYYPDVLEKAYILHAPYYVGLGWSVIRPLLAQNARDAIGMYSGKDVPAKMEDDMSIAEVMVLKNAHSTHRAESGMGSPPGDAVAEKNAERL